MWTIAGGILLAILLLILITVALAVLLPIAAVFLFAVYLFVAAALDIVAAALHALREWPRSAARALRHTLTRTVPCAFVFLAAWFASLFTVFLMVDKHIILVCPCAAASIALWRLFARLWRARYA